MAELTIGSLCSGYGGLTLAVQAAVGGHPIWHSEIEPAADKVLEARFPGVPNLGDMTAVDWASIPPVTVLDGGTPCQDVSAAGARRGMRSGTRSGLWSAMADAIDVLRPRLVVWENVRGVLSAGADSDVEPCPGCVGDGTGPVLRALGRVLGDLADLGYDAGWCGLRASDVGAPHPRYRIFVVAEDADQSARGERWVAAPGGAEGGRSWPDAGGRDRAPVTDATRERHGHTGTASVGGMAAAAISGAPADSDRGRPEQLGRVEPDTRDADRRDGPDTAWGPYEPAVRRWERVVGPAPAPREPGRTGERLSPRFVEWMMGLPAGWVTDVPGVTRNDQLKMLGNGVVWQQGAAGIRHVLERR